MRKFDLEPKLFFEILGEHGINYFLYEYRTAKPKLHLREFNSLKEARQFICKYAYETPQWLNVDGDINEYHNKPSRPDSKNKWYNGVVNKEYMKYVDFKE